MNLAKVIDHTLLKPTATREQIEASAYPEQAYTLGKHLH